MPTAREQILGRVRAALDAAPAGPQAPQGADYPPQPDEPGSSPTPAASPGEPGAEREDLVELFVERSGEYRATVRRAELAELAELLAEICAEHGASRLARPPGLPAEWEPEGVELVPDDPPLSARTLDQLDGVLTGCALAVAETGTVVLDHGPRQGRRALTLLPDLHLCIVDTASVVADIPDAIAALESAVDDGRPVTLVSGPSATSDIELDRVEGVHGPRRLELVVVEATPSS